MSISYVQRSVANNLNDISKDHPERVVALCRAWAGDAPEGRRWIIKHALRSLIKRGHPGALTLLGVGARPRITLDRVEVAPRPARRGGRVAIAFELSSTARKQQDLLIDYVVHYVKKSGGRRPKVFKLRRVQLAPGGSLRLSATLSLRDMTTRKHYPGQHAVDLLINGTVFELCAFEVA